MKVYMLEDFIPYEDTWIEGIFSSVEKAEEAAESIKFIGEKQITEYEVDPDSNRNGHRIDTSLHNGM